ncbi:carboxy-terminal domain RNA polymerase II polypeptide A small phosphatase [Raphidocelis subcapitata]|uniref:Carboxy-terminal domain RNA polymerase II polypeptide A small phosphatase n=1 Tax=Raphidocelis subcapitata TaxID=307507 RepID=A0A2V0NZC9_9CHLO|nr:carboxy-terminal domain RNA polymerase II polypeptide A small phosphatase [Raphidocelis subcapitata]|eukprot:GBF92984.1 carboxy-terminal domain RNA polymerase II polypeptide A small phosphatase [Raphidocelis subcapitata]
MRDDAEPHQGGAAHLLRPAKGIREAVDDVAAPADAGRSEPAAPGGNAAASPPAPGGPGVRPPAVAGGSSGSGSGSSRGGSSRRGRRSGGSGGAAAAGAGWKGRFRSMLCCIAPPPPPAPPAGPMAAGACGGGGTGADGAAVPVAAAAQQQLQHQEQQHPAVVVSVSASAASAAAAAAGDHERRGCLPLAFGGGAGGAAPPAAAAAAAPHLHPLPPPAFSSGCDPANPITSVGAPLPAAASAALARFPFSPPVPPRAYAQAVIGAKRPEDAGKKTLVLDLDETLVHSSFKPIPNPDYIIPVEIDGRMVDVYVLKRPWLDHFMATVGPRFEVVVFTASLAKYADPLLDLMDTAGNVRWRLFREACCPFEGNYVKDLLCLGRDLSGVIIVDNSPHSYVFQPDNAVPISTFIDDMEDQELLEILPQLLKVEAVDDVRALLGPQNVAGYLAPPPAPAPAPPLPSPRGDASADADECDACDAACACERGGAAAPAAAAGKALAAAAPAALAPLGVRC